VLNFSTLFLAKKHGIENSKNSIGVEFLYTQEMGAFGPKMTPKVPVKITGWPKQLKKSR
jgi:hypothetical protein